MSKKPNLTRQTFTDEFKQNAVRLVDKPMMVVFVSSLGVGEKPATCGSPAVADSEF